MFTQYSIENAPEASGKILSAVHSKMGFVPNLFAYIAESPNATAAYAQLDQLLNQTSLEPIERQLILLTTSVTNGCEFCVAAHSAGATKARADKETLAAVRRGDNPADAKLAALVTFVRTLVQERGWASEDDVKAFLAAGFSKENIFDVIMAVSLKTLSNYSNHLTQPPLNPELEPFAWSAEKELS